VTSRFIHLHTHSEYSILDSSCSISGLVTRAAECGMDAIALTDHGVMSGAIKFYKQALKRNIKPILGCEIYVAPGDRRDRSVQNGQRYYHLVLLAESNVGYRNLLQIVSAAHTEGFYYRPRADRELLQRHAEGLIALSACESGEIPRLLSQGRPEAAAETARWLQSIFGEESFFIEIQHHGTDRDAKVRAQLIELAGKLDMPLVATNDIHYLSADDKLAHEVLLNIRANKTINDPEHRSFDGEGFHFRTAKEMEALFPAHPEAIDNTRRIADRCNVEIDFGNAMIPPFELPEGHTDPDEYLRELAEAGAIERFGSIDETVRQRLEFELAVIQRMAYSTYFLIVWDFVHFARENGISVGPGRGSAAGSLVSYALHITNVDPLKYVLTFERFLNPDRISMPDFDIDFCVKGRDEVIDYVRRKYGGERWWERIAQIATFDRMAARSVVRDVGRVLGMPYSVPDRIAKLIPFGWNLQAAVERVTELQTLYKDDPDIRRLIDIGKRLEGLTRNASTHAAGLVIAPDRLDYHVPLLRLGEEEFVTQFDMIDVEAVGLLKFDFLGLRNLTLIEDACAAIKESSGDDLCVEEIPLDDEETFALIRAGRTAGIFQLESSGMTNLILRIQPDRFEDLIALIALFRPGPLESGTTDEYVERRQGRVPVEYSHPKLEPVLKDTFGLPIYQEQIMLMAQSLAGFTLAEADILRKAMGKKKKEIMDSLKVKFIQGCLDNGISQVLAESTFADMEKFSRYGFGKSHTTAYAFVSYWTAYLKAHHPTQFMAALLTSIQSDSDKVAEYIGECREMSVEVLPPDINESRQEFAAVAEGRIRFGLGAIKHVGRNAIAAILGAREEGPFASFFDMCRRVEDDGLDREALEALVKAGAFDGLGLPRRGLLRHLSEGIELMHRKRHERATGQTSFFADLGEETADPIITEMEFDQRDLLAFERELLGLYITAHPLDDHREVLDFYCLSAREAKSLRKGEGGIVGGRIKKVRRIDTKRGEPMAFVTVEDGLEDVEITVFPRVLGANPELLQEDQLVGIRVEADARNGDVGLIAVEALTLDQVADQMTLSLLLTIDATALDNRALGELQQQLMKQPGDTPVCFHLVDPLGSIDVRAHERFFVSPADGLQSKLKHLPGVVEAEFRSSP